MLPEPDNEKHWLSWGARKLLYFYGLDAINWGSYLLSVDKKASEFLWARCYKLGFVRVGVTFPLYSYFHPSPITHHHHPHHHPPNSRLEFQSLIPSSSSSSRSDKNRLESLQHWVHNDQSHSSKKAEILPQVNLLTPRPPPSSSHPTKERPPTPSQNSLNRNRPHLPHH